MAEFGNRVKETTTTTGTGTLDLDGAPTGFRAFSNEFTSGDSRVRYLIVDDPDNPTDYEIGLGTFNTGTPNTLSRDTVEASSNSDNKVSWSAGTKTVVNLSSAADLELFVNSEDRDVAEQEVVNTVTETTVYSYSVPANTLGSNRELFLHAKGDYLNNSGAGSDFTVKVKLGSTTIFTGPTVNHSANASRRSWTIKAYICAANATNAQRVDAQYVAPAIAHAVDGIAGSAGNTLYAATHNSVAEDSTSALTLSITVQHGTAAATISAKALTVQLVRA